MNSQPDPQLEAWVSRQLQSLPELSAPRTLAPRIFAALAAQSAPTPARGWQGWPLALRLASFAGLAAVFLALCFGGWQVSQSPTVTNATQDVTGVLTMLRTLGTALEAVLGALVQVVKQLGPVWLSLIALVVISGWVSCLGLGTAFFRLAWSRR
jgi:hypothetical protein